MIYYQNPTVTVEWDDSIGAPILTRTRFAKGEQHQEPLEKVIELLKEKGGHKLLMDARKAPVMDPDDLEWLTKTWVPQAIAAGLRWQAVVMPSAALTQMQVQRVSKREHTGYESRYFDNMDDAKVWLRSVK